MTRYQPRHQRARTRPVVPRWLRASGVALIIAAASYAAYGLFPFDTGGTSPTRTPAQVAAAPAVPSPPAAVIAMDEKLGFANSAIAGWVAAENAKPGSSGWRLTKPATNGQIAGYADQVSVNAGSPVGLYVSTSAVSYSAAAYRMGFYGGAEGRLVWTSDTISGTQQPACPLISRTRTIRCSWSDPVTVATTGWPQGDYLFKLTSSTGWETHIPLTVRDDSSHAAYLLNNSVTTWEAYNLFGGYDLYQGPTGGGHAGLAGRSQIVSFDRPYVLGNGGGDFVGLELPMVSTMESLGLDVTYTTNVDISERPGLLMNHRSFISLGHDEYYTLAMRDGLTAARDAGVNLIFLGANAAYRHIRLEPSSLGPNRNEVDYKDAHADPLLGKDNADVTPWAWRVWPNNRPESDLLGEMWQCNPVQTDMVISDSSSWLFAGTALQNGSHITQIVGPEYDHFDPYAPNPGNVSVVARSPVRCDGMKEEADMTYYSAASGAGVWDTGTIEWVGSVLPYCPTCTHQSPVTKITTNVLAAFGAGPAGAAHPSKANVFRSGGAPATTTTLNLPEQNS